VDNAESIPDWVDLIHPLLEYSLAVWQGEIAGDFTVRDAYIPSSTAHGVDQPRLSLEAEYVPRIGDI